MFLWISMHGDAGEERTNKHTPLPCANICPLLTFPQYLPFPNRASLIMFPKRMHAMPSAAEGIHDVWLWEGRMTKEWANEEDIQAQLAAEESDNSIELIVSYILSSDSPDWQERRMLQCSHEFMGRKKNYQNKHAWERKIPSKKTGCPCTMMLKWYLETETILGKYKDQHNHVLGDNNLQFTRLSGKARNIVMDMVTPVSSLIALWGTMMLFIAKLMTIV